MVDLSASPNVSEDTRFFDQGVMLSEQWISLKADIILLSKQQISTSDSDFEHLLDKLLKHYISGNDSKGGVQLRAAMRASAADELEQTKQTISSLKEDRRKQNLLIKQLFSDVKNVKAAVSNRETILADSRATHLKEVLALKNEVVKLRLQIDQMSSSSADLPDRRAIQKIQAELMQLRKECSRHQSQEEQYLKSQETAAKVIEYQCRIAEMTGFIASLQESKAVCVPFSKNLKDGEHYHQKADAAVQTDTLNDKAIASEIDSLRSHFERIIKRIHEEYQEQISKRDSDLIFIARATLRSKEIFLDCVVSREQSAIADLSVEVQRMIASIDYLVSMTDVLDLSDFLDQCVKGVIASENVHQESDSELKNQIEKLLNEIGEISVSLRAKESDFDHQRSLLVQKIEQDHQEIQHLRHAVEEYEWKMSKIETVNARMQSLVSQYEGYVSDQPMPVQSIIQQLQDGDTGLLMHRYEENFVINDRDGSTSKNTCEFCQYLDVHLLNPIRTQILSASSNPSHETIKRHVCSKISMLISLIARCLPDKTPLANQMLQTADSSHVAQITKEMEHIETIVNNLATMVEEISSKIHAAVKRIADLLLQIAWELGALVIETAPSEIGLKVPLRQSSPTLSLASDLIATNTTAPVQQLISVAANPESDMQERIGRGTTRSGIVSEAFKPGIPLLVARQVHMGQTTVAAGITPRTVISSSPGIGPPTTQRVQKLPSKAVAFTSRTPRQKSDSTKV